MLPILWSFRRCPYAMRVRLAIKSSGIAVELREILLRDKPAEFVATSPKATVPVLKSGDGAVLEESRDIIFWALEKNDPEGWLECWHKDRAGVETFLDELDGPFKTHLDRYKYASRYARQGEAGHHGRAANDDQGEALEHRAAGSLFLQKINNALGDMTDAPSGEGALSGGNLGLMDYASLPFVRQFRIADPQWFDEQNWPHLHSWLGAFLDGDKFASVMTKYEPWQEGQTGVTFPS